MTTGAPGDGARHAFHGDSALGTRVTLSGRNPCRDRRHLGLRFLHRYAGPQAGNRVEPAHPARGSLISRKGEWNPNVRGLPNGKSEPRGKNADDKIWESVEGNGLSEHVWGSAKAVAPILVGKNRDSFAALRILAGQEVASHYGSYSQSMEEIRAHLLRGNLLGISCARERVALLLEHGHVLEDAALRAPVFEVGSGNIHIISRPVRPGRRQIDESFRLWIRQRPQNPGFDQAEDRSIGSNAHRQSQDRDPGKGGILAQHAQAIAGVA